MTARTASNSKIRVLVFSTLFPNEAQPAHGLFVWRRLQEVLATGRISAKVVAPVPWFPFAHRRFGEYGRFAAVPDREVRDGVEVVHPRYLVIPKVGMRVTPWTLGRAGLAAARQLRSAGFDFDLIDAHYFYPDGVAASLVGKTLGRPVVITARGTDISLIPRDAVARRRIVAAAESSGACVAVCQALKDEMVDLGIGAERITVLRNGVDLQGFQPIDRLEARRRLGLEGRNWLLSVGLLIDRKGHDITIRALRDLPGYSLVIAGDGPLRPQLQLLARDMGVADRVRFAGLVPADELPVYYSAADASILASSREGWANVLLESMACGTPVVASAVWGTPEVVSSRAAGRLMADRTPVALAEAVRQLAADCPAREATRAYAEQFGWESTTRGQLDIFGRLAGIQV